MLDETSFEKFKLSDYPIWSTGAIYRFSVQKSVKIIKIPFLFRTERLATYKNLQLYIDPTVVLNFFPICHRDFDLMEVFPDSNISAKDLGRRSSADWSDLRGAKK